MEKRKTTVQFPTGLLWSVTILLWILVIIWALDGIGNNDRTFSSIIVLVFQLLCWIVFIIEIAGSDIYNKAAWIIMVIITPMITFPIYLFQKRRLLRIQQRKVDFMNKHD